MILVGTFSGFPSAIRWGMPGSSFRFWEVDYRRIIFWGLRVQAGRANLAMHKKLQNLMEEASYHDKTLFSPLDINPNDYLKGVPVRMKWSKNNPSLSYVKRLGEIGARTVVMVGRYDPEGPVPCSEELIEEIPDAKLVIFEESGHYPFIEEERFFTKTLGAFLNEGIEMVPG